MQEKETPFLTKEKIEEIVKSYETPFHIYDEKGIRENARNLYRAFSWNPGFREYFAVKATPNPFIMKILREEGCGMDCSSLTELMLSERCRIGGEDIMFSSNNTPASDYRYALKLGAVINFDDITHIDFFEKNVGSIPRKVSCRFNPGGYFAISNKIMDSPGDAKYGMTRPQMFQAYRLLMDKGAKSFGIHAFLASNTETDDYYAELSGQLMRLAVELRDETGAKIDFINLSGGIGIPYRPDGHRADIMKIGESVRRVYESVLTPAGMGDVKLCTELGRFMLGPYGHLVTRAIHRKHIHKNYIGVDATACDLMRPAMYGAYHHISVAGKESELRDHMYDVVGGLCENNDKFAVDRWLPQILMGDYLIIHDTGAHGHAMGYNYNGKLRSRELLLREDDSVVEIRRPENVDDYFATLDFEKLDKFDGR